MLAPRFSILERKISDRISKDHPTVPPILLIVTITASVPTLSSSGCCLEVLLPVSATGNHRWPQIMFSLSTVTEKAWLHLSLLSLSSSPSILIGCQCEQPAVGQRENSDYKALFLEEAGGCTVCQAELSKEGWGSIWVDYWLFPSFSLSLSVFPSATHLFLFLWLHSSLLFFTHLPRQWMESIPLTNCEVLQPKRHEETQMFVTAAWHERIWRSIRLL